MFYSWICTNPFTTKRGLPLNCHFKSFARYLQGLFTHVQWVRLFMQISCFQPWHFCSHDEAIGIDLLRRRNIKYGHHECSVLRWHFIRTGCSQWHKYIWHARSAYSLQLQTNTTLLYGAMDADFCWRVSLMRHYYKGLVWNKPIVMLGSPRWQPDVCHVSRSSSELADRYCVSTVGLHSPTQLIMRFSKLVFVILCYHVAFAVVIASAFGR